MTPLTRWKFLCGTLAIATGVLLLRSPSGPPAPIAATGRLPVTGAPAPRRRIGGGPVDG